MDNWQEISARAIRREQRPSNPLERMKIAQGSKVGENYRRGWNDAIADVIALESQRNAYLDDLGEHSAAVKRRTDEDPWTEGEKRAAWGDR